MNENQAQVLALVLAGLGGCLLGALFFFGLWWTVRKGISSKRPVLWFLGSLLLRTGIVLAGFFLISGGRWERLLACLLGFVSARFLVTLRVHSGLRSEASTTPQAEEPVYSAEEANHAP